MNQSNLAWFYGVHIRGSRDGQAAAAYERVEPRVRLRVNEALEVRVGVDGAAGDRCNHGR